MIKSIPGARAGAPYSAAIAAEGPFLFVSGQVPGKPGESVSESIEEQTKGALDNLGTVLKRAGASFSDVVRCNIYLTDLSLAGAMNAVYESYFDKERLPARTTVGAALIRSDVKIEIDCVAVLRR